MERVPSSILFVCTGNTCRSPMAAVLCANLINRYYPEYKNQIRIMSAGCAAWEGVSATEEAKNAMAAKGLCLAEHRAKKLDASLLMESDLIVTMSESHWHYIVTTWPQVQDRTFTLKELAGEVGDVIDPIGLGDNFYRDTAEELERLLKVMLQNLLGTPSGDGCFENQGEE